MQCPCVRELPAQQWRKRTGTTEKKMARTWRTDLNTDIKIRVGFVRLRQPPLLFSSLTIEDADKSSNLQHTKHNIRWKQVHGRAQEHEFIQSRACQVALRKNWRTTNMLKRIASTRKTISAKQSHSPGGYDTVGFRWFLFSSCHIKRIFIILEYQIKLFYKTFCTDRC